MYNLDFKNLRKGYGFGSLFAGVGILFFCILMMLTFSGLVKKQFMDSKIIASKIADNCYRNEENQEMCSPIYYYTVKDMEYSCTISYSSSGRPSKNQKYVYYDSSNPKNCVTDYQVKQSIFMYLLCLFPLIFIYVGVKHIMKVYKKIKRVKHLMKYGTLITNLPYTMEATGMSVNNRNLLAPAIDYTHSTGTVLHLVGEPRFDGKLADSDGMIDLLIDLQDLNNYFIDFNIAKK